MNKEYFTKVGGVSYHDYYGVVIDETEKKEIIRNLGPTNKVR